MMFGHAEQEMCHDEQGEPHNMKKNVELIIKPSQHCRYQRKDEVGSI